MITLEAKNNSISYPENLVYSDVLISFPNWDKICEVDNCFRKVYFGSQSQGRLLSGYSLKGEMSWRKGLMDKNSSCNTNQEADMI